MTIPQILVVAFGGFVAGAVNAVAGGGTLVSFPALLAAGLTPFSANITSSVGLLTGYLGGSVAYRRELEGQGSRIRGLAVAAIIGGVLGALLLLVTPSDTFDAVVPWLVLASCALLGVQPRLARFVSARRVDAPDRESEITWPIRIGVLFGAVYGSYFGAGLGVLLLAVLGILLNDHLQRLNAVKGLLSLLVNVVGVLVFVWSGEVAWLAAAVLAVSAYAGGTVGVSIARRLSPTLLRGGIIVLGVIVGVVMLVR